MGCVYFVCRQLWIYTHDATTSLLKSLRVVGVVMTRSAQTVFLFFFVALAGCVTDGGKKADSDPKAKVWFDTTFYASGRIERIQTMKDSLRDGYAFVTYETGERKKQEHYVNDIRNGWSFFWWQNGQLNQETYAKPGGTYLICFKVWDENGVPGRQDTCEPEYYLDTTYKQLSHL